MNVPKYEELSLKIVYDKVLDRFPDLENYFPDYDKNYLPPWDYFWSIFSTLEPEFCKRLLSWAHEKRVINEENQPEETIRIWDDML